MTSTALKAQIDSQITNETLANSISPTDVGTNLKSVVDYVDQETSKDVGDVIGVTGNTAILIYGINRAGQTSSNTDKVILPETNVKIGSVIYVFCIDSCRIRGNVAGDTIIYISYSSIQPYIDGVQDDRYRFTKINTIDWMVEKINDLV